jgi:fatty-acyl-CoA synthase
VSGPNAAWQRALEATAAIGRNPLDTLPAVLAATAEARGDAAALLSDRERLSYRDLACRADRYARWALRHGVVRGEVVWLLMANRPEYVALWLGITRVGGVVALANTHLVGDSLLHSLTLVAPRHVIVGAELAGAFAAIRPRLDPAIRCWIEGGDGLVPLDGAADGGADALAPAPPPSLADTALLIYTSGTTGPPKAARVSHFRLMQWSHWFAGLMAVRPDDRMYNCLPLYHSVGGVVATGATLVGGGAVVVRERFSAHRFWSEVAEWECTLFQYIGELCRYLVQSPPHPLETAHRLRLCCGNGLRAEVWEPFRERFRIPQIIEFYAATEGTFSLYNCDGTPGSIGRIPPFLAHRFPVALVRFDSEAGEPLRGADGFCVHCAEGETGEAIARLEGRGFEGYTDAAASERKILRSVFAAGDAWYRTGDLMRRDARGNFYFVDRVGDTYRWKGENVSTLEVAAALEACPGVGDAAVYGVAVPHHDGRAGMAAIVADAAFDLGRLRRHLAARLPAYAWPMFLRLCDGIELTGTFKPQKHRLAQQGYDPRQIADRLYVNDAAAGAFVPLDAALYEAIQSGRRRL